MIALNIDPSAFDITGSKDYLKRTYEMVEQMEPLYLKYRGIDKLMSYVKKSDTDYGTYPLAAGVIYELAPNKFLIEGMMSNFTFRAKAGKNKKVDILRLEEGNVVNGEWKAGRILNGDEKMSIGLGDMPGWKYVEVYKY